MGTTRDFIVSALADTLLPMFSRSMEDAVYETIDKRQIPTRTDFKEVRDLVNNLRGQVTGTTSGIQRIVDQIETLSSRIDALEARITDEVPAEAPLSKTLTCKASGCDDRTGQRGFARDTTSNGNVAGYLNFRRTPKRPVLRSTSRDG